MPVMLSAMQAELWAVQGGCVVKLGGEGLGRKLEKVPPRKSFRQDGINYAAGQAHAKAAGRVGVLLCSAVF